MRSIRCVLAAALFAGAVTGAQRQQVVVAWDDDVSTVLLTNAALQTELKLTAEQKGNLKPAAEKHAAFNKEFTDAFGPAAGGGFDVDKFNALREKQAKVAAEVKAAVDEVLTADQRKRLKQIGLRALGFTVFNDPDVAPFQGPNCTDAQKAAMREVRVALKLSAEQRKTVAGIADGFVKESRALRGEVEAEKVAAADAKINEAYKTAWAKIEGDLNEAQKKAWNELFGEPFDLSKLRPTPKK